MKTLSCFFFAVTLLASAAVAQSSTPASTPSHPKKAKHTHTLRHKGKKKQAPAPTSATPNSPSSQPEATPKVAPSTPHI